jgi:predicted transcriptional regulator
MRTTNAQRGLCEVVGCSGETNDRKPYCLEHLGRLTYIHELHQMMQERDQEVEALRRNPKRRIRSDSLVVREILVFLSKGTISLQKLAREINLQVGVLRTYVQRLHRARKLNYIKVKSLRGSQRELVALM